MGTWEESTAQGQGAGRDGAVGLDHREMVFNATMLGAAPWVRVEGEGAQALGLPSYEGGWERPEEPAREAKNGGQGGEEAREAKNGGQGREEAREAKNGGQGGEEARAAASREAVVISCPEASRG